MAEKEKKLIISYCSECVGLIHKVDKIISYDILKLWKT